jgi:hypothetical protein
VRAADVEIISTQLMQRDRKFLHVLPQRLSKSLIEVNLCVA